MCIGFTCTSIHGVWNLDIWLFLGMEVIFCSISSERPTETLWLHYLLWTLPAFSFSWAYIQSVGLFGWGNSPLPTHRTTQTQNKCTHTSMPRVGFELTIPVFERAKTVNALDRAATVIGSRNIAVNISESGKYLINWEKVKYFYFNHFIPDSNEIDIIYIWNEVEHNIG
jgi:hypothetical protein